MRKDPQATGPLHGGVTIGRLMAGVDYSRPLRPKWSGTAGISFQVRVSFLVQILDRLISLVLVSVISIKLLHRNLMFWENTNSFPASWSSRWTWTSESCGHVWRASYIQVIALVLPKVTSKIFFVHLSLLGMHWEVYMCNCLFFCALCPHLSNLIVCPLQWPCLWWHAGGETGDCVHRSRRQWLLSSKKLLNFKNKSSFFFNIFLVTGTFHFSL